MDQGKPSSGAEAYVRAWRHRGAAMNAERLRELRQLTEREAARRFARSLQLPGPYPLRPSSGLVEQQRVFSRLRRDPE